jgi:pilus assembly protein CpaF
VTARRSEPVPPAGPVDLLAGRLAVQVRDRLAGAGGRLGSVGRTAGLADQVRSAAASAGIVLGVDDLLAVTSRVEQLLWGWGPLAPVLADPAVSDLLVNGPDDIWLDRGRGLERVPVRLGTEQAVRELAVRLAGAAGRRLDDAAPWVDARLAGGVRLHAVIPPISPDGTRISVRIQRAVGLDLAAIELAGGVPPGWADVLRRLVTARASFLISGGTGAGKTTLLTAMLSLVPPTERLVLVEDVGELLPDHPHVVRLEARHPNVEGRGAVGLDELVRQALRMRPDRLVVGECRGAEVRDLLAALNTGHAGGCGTVHANASGDVPARLEALGSMAGLDSRAVRVQAAAALDAVLHLRREGPLRRWVELAAVIRDEAGGLRLQPALTAGVAVDDPGRRGPGWLGLAERFALPEPPGSVDDR